MLAVWHTVVGPVIAPGSPSTVSVVVVIQPVDDDVKVTTDVPAATPPASPVVLLIVAIPGDADIHVPAAALLSCVVEPAHTVNVPTIADGTG
jgi:hypothetical protein